VTLPAPLADVDAALRVHFGTSPLRASVSFVGVETIEVLRFEPIPDERAYLSLGMSRHPMTSAAAGVQAADGPRAELMLHVRDGADEHAGVWRQVALLAAAPAVEGVVYVPDMTVDLGTPLSAGARCTGALITQSPIAAVETIVGSVAVLQLLPATANELAWCRVHGAAALRERWAAQAVDLLDLRRDSATLG
jgi:hypothetical protein